MFKITKFKGQLKIIKDYESAMSSAINAAYDVNLNASELNPLSSKVKSKKEKNWIVTLLVNVFISPL